MKNVIQGPNNNFFFDSKSYQYLAESIRMHPDQDLLKEMVLSAGFKECKFYNLLNGIVAIHIGNND